MRIIKYTLIIGCFALLVSCSTSKSSLKDLRQLTTQVNEEGSTYGVSEWKYAINKYTKIDKKIAKHAAKGEYNNNEMEEIGRLQAGCLKGFAKGVGVNVTSKINNVQSFLKGLFDNLYDKEREE